MSQRRYWGGKCGRVAPASTDLSARLLLLVPGRLPVVFLVCLPLLRDSRGQLQSRKNLRTYLKAISLFQSDISLVGCGEAGGPLREVLVGEILAVLFFSFLVFLTM